MASGATATPIGTMGDADPSTVPWRDLVAAGGDVDARLGTWAPAVEGEANALLTRLNELHQQMGSSELRTSAAVMAGEEQMSQTAAAVMQTAAFTTGLSEAACQAVQGLRADLERTVTNARTEFRLG